MQPAPSSQVGGASVQIIAPVITYNNCKPGSIDCTQSIPAPVANDTKPPEVAALNNSSSNNVVHTIKIEVVPSSEFSKAPVNETSKNAETCKKEPAPSVCKEDKNKKKEEDLPVCRPPTETKKDDSELPVCRPPKQELKRKMIPQDFWPDEEQSSKIEDKSEDKE